MHSQSRVESFIESSLNIGSGFVISLLLWMYVVAPLFDVDVTFTDNLAITGMFTVTSVIRSYVWRRLFNKRLHRKLEQLFSEG